MRNRREWRGREAGGSTDDSLNPIPGSASGRLFGNRYIPYGSDPLVRLEQPSCDCFTPSRISAIHTEPQDTECDAWSRLLEVVDQAAASGVTEFAPGPVLGWEAWWQIVTLPPTIAKLKSVKRVVLYGSNLDRIPPEIGEMRSLEEFDAYTSYRLHWLPYEIVRCPNLRSSCMSTRALYGNFKYRHPFPELNDDPSLLPVVTPADCSICRRPLRERVVRRWISLNIATDVVPLLVNACSMECIYSLPTPPDNYVKVPHAGGSHIERPPKYSP